MNPILEEIRPETAERIAAVAREKGVSVDQLLSDLLPDVNGDAGNQPFYKTATADEWSRELRNWAASHPTRNVVADDSRESIYEGRGE
jgi:hypothetical protein